MKTGNRDMGKAEQYDLMFEKYHGFKHPKSDTPGRSDKLHFKIAENNISSSSILPAYVQFLEGKDCYDVKVKNDVFLESTDDLEGEDMVLTLYCKEEFDCCSTCDYNCQIQMPHHWS